MNTTADTHRVPDGPLDSGDVEHFLQFGYVKLENCFDTSPGSLAWRWRTETWRRCGYDPEDPSTWAEEKIHFNPSERVALAEFAPRVLGAMRQLLGGREIANAPLTWGNGMIVNYRLGADKPWAPPGPDTGDWHKDGDFFLHFLDSPEQGLLTLVLWDDVVERAGPTYIAADSVPHIARFLAEHPEGVCPLDGTERYGLPDDTPQFNFPDMIRRCSDFRQATGRGGDVYLLHPFMLHASSQNVLKRPRFISNPPVSLREPMQFNRPADAYSPVERAVLAALGVSRFDFAPTVPRRGIDGGAERRRRAAEVERLAALAQGSGPATAKTDARAPH